MVKAIKPKEKIIIYILDENLNFSTFLLNVDYLLYKYINYDL